MLCADLVACFNPLTGIRSFLTLILLEEGLTIRFNPLTGIRSFLTVMKAADPMWIFEEFQSPHGDSFFSDPRHMIFFNQFYDTFVSIPSRGFVLF